MIQSLKAFSIATLFILGGYTYLTAGCGGASCGGHAKAEAATEKKSCSTKAKSCSTEKKSCSTKAKSCSTEKKSCSTKAKACSTDKKSCSTKAKACSTDKKSCDSKQKTECKTESCDKEKAKGSEKAS